MNHIQESRLHGDRGISFVNSDRCLTQVKSEGNKYILRPTNEEKRVYLVHLLEKVLMTGIPQIVTEGNNKRRIFKLFVFVACLTGFLYQLGTFLSFYFTYPTSLEILVKYKTIKKLPKPMVTICNLNEVRRTMYCRDFPDNCEKPKNVRNFCQHFHHFCQKENYNDEDLLFPLPHYYYYTSHNRTLIEKYGDGVEDMLNPYRNFSNRVILANDGVEIRKCYTVDLSKVYSNEFAKENYIHYSKRLVTESNIFVEMNVTFNPEETFYPTIPVGARLSVHSRTQLINPFINGVLIRPGRKYGIQLRIIEHNLLPAPYRTNCKKYDRSHGKTRHILYSRDASIFISHCLYECKRKIWIDECGCVSTEYPFVIDTKERFCDATADFYSNNKINVTSCYNECQKECNYVAFEYNVEKFPTSILHPVELFGYVGGYIGMWLGISLIAMGDESIECIQIPMTKNERRPIHLRKLLENVTMTGIAQIARERNCRRMFFKLFIFIACLIGFIFQLIQFFLFYFTYPTTLNILIEHKDTKDLPKPMVTICDMNSIRRSSYCRKFSKQCAKLKNVKVFCDRFHRFCEIHNITEEDLVFPGNYFYETAQYQRSIINEFGVRSEDILPLILERNDIIRTIALDVNLKYRNCYSIDLGNPLSENNTIKSTVHVMDRRLFLKDPRKVGEVFVQFNPADIFCPTYPLGAMVAIHSKDYIINPFINGFPINPKYRYIIQLKPLRKSSLPSPYGTNCTRYRNTNNIPFDKVLSRARCLYECKKRLWIKSCGCISPEYPFVIDEKFCEIGEVYTCLNQTNVESCYSECQRDCIFTIFEYDIQKLPIHNFHEVSFEDIHSHGHHKSKPYAVLNLFFKNSELVIHEYKPKFQSIELFSYIGGFIGIWLGISLVAVFDFFEVISIYLYHTIRVKICSRKNNVI
ncbi:uncharacterized protein [Centruroides vittatus]|uniref:uncharacterized protein n=1 Tax=Centruroides vittatus TaxID=120091 RepID=UPI00350FEA7C